VLADVACKQPRPDVVAASGRIADDEVDGLACIELLRRLRADVVSLQAGHHDSGRGEEASKG